jgi:hypothetical protein
MRLEKFMMQDSVFSVEIEVPHELDSFFVWVDTDDHSCGMLRKYRFANSKYPILKESGFFHPEYPDSSYSLTFFHIDKYECKDVFIGKTDLDSWVNIMTKRDSLFELYYKSERKINDIEHSVIAYKMNMTEMGYSYPSVIIQSNIYVDSVAMRIIYECVSKDCDNFVTRMKKSLQTIKVKKIEHSE